MSDRAIEDLLRELAPQVLGVLVRRYGDFDAAEDALQEALLAASEHWAEALPESPRGWLIQTASRKLIDQARSDQARRRRETLAATRDVPAEARQHDDELTVLFLCCHPSLTPASAVALTLRAAGGLSTAEIARALLVPEATVAQRISRAKQRIKSSGVPFRMPEPKEYGERVRAVLRVLYLIFNEGYASSAGDHLHRVELSAEAIRVTRALWRMLPDEGEVAGLLALMLLTDARRAARTGPDGDLVPMDEQDRALWDRRLIAEGLATLDAAMTRGAIGEYQLQAMIAALHDRAPRAEDTDWTQISALYGLLERLTGSPVVTLNRAVAVSMHDGPEAGLRMLEPLDERLPGHHRLDAVRAHLHERAGDLPAAIRHYRAAASATSSLPEQRYLTLRAARLHAQASTRE